MTFSTSRLCLRLYAHRYRRLTASAVSDRASLEDDCHALAIGYRLRRHRFAPLTVTGSFGWEGAAITAGEKNGDRQHNSEDRPERPRQPENVHRGASLQRSRDGASLHVDAKTGSSALGHAAFERHYRIGDLATWQLGRETVRRLMKDEPGVIRIRLGRKKSHTSYSVPESVAVRIHTRLLNSR